MLTNTPVGVFRAIVILPSCVDFTVVHRLLRQTSTFGGPGRNGPGAFGLHLDEGLAEGYISGALRRRYPEVGW